MPKATINQKEVGKGTGMGMAVLHGVVRSYGGHTLVETDLGKGTTIHLLFPAVTTEEGGASALETPPQQLPQGQRHHVLVLDDEPELADYVGELLELHKYQATILTDSHDALDLFLQDPDKFSLLVTDQTMPGRFVSASSMAELIFALSSPSVRSLASFWAACTCLLSPFSLNSWSSGNSPRL